MLRQLPNQSELYDENVFRTLMEYEVTRSQRYPSPLSLLRIGLALINPTQTEVENAPIALATMLNMRLRQADIPARIGEEFAVLMPNTDEKSARAVSERLLRITLGTHNTPLGFSTRVTICIGLSTQHGGPNLNAGQLMSEAESALKQARTIGPQTCRAFSDTVIRKQ
jgi:diguanylate cyclase (GGDEF)-like protein